MYYPSELVWIAMAFGKIRETYFPQKSIGGLAIPIWLMSFVHSDLAIGYYWLCCHAIVALKAFFFGQDQGLF